MGGGVGAAAGAAPGRADGAHAALAGAQGRGGRGRGLEHHAPRAGLDVQQHLGTNIINQAINQSINQSIIMGLVRIITFVKHKIISKPRL